MKLMKRFKRTNNRTALAVSTFLCLGGCATQQQPLYYWGNYQSVVYTHFKSEKGPEDQIQSLEQVKEEAKAKGKTVPPGFHAHLGMLYGQTGRMDRLVENFDAEKTQYPEGAAFMNLLLDKFKPSAAR